MRVRIQQLGTSSLIVTAVAIAYYAYSTPQPSALPAPAVATPASDSSTSISFPIHEAPKSLPALSFVDGDRQKRTLASFKGKLVLLNIWATWCTPCREEMPTLDRLQAKLGSAEFEVVALSIDQADVSLIEDFYDELSLEALAVYVDPTGNATTTLNVIGIPATLLINSQGDEIGRMLGPAEWDAPEMVDTIRQYLPAE